MSGRQVVLVFLFLSCVSVYRKTIFSMIARRQPEVQMNTNKLLRFSMHSLRCCWFLVLFHFCSSPWFSFLLLKLYIYIYIYIEYSWIECGCAHICIHCSLSQFETFLKHISVSMNIHFYVGSVCVCYVIMNNVVLFVQQGKSKTLYRVQTLKASFQTDLYMFNAIRFDVLLLIICNVPFNTIIAHIHVWTWNATAEYTCFPMNLFVVIFSSFKFAFSQSIN